MARSGRTTEHPADHLRPMARRLPVRRRPSGGEDAECRRARRRRRHVSPPLCRRRTLLAGARLPLHRPLPDDQPRLPQRHAARRAPRQHRRFARRLGYDPTLFGYTDTAPDPRQLAPHDPLLQSYEGVLPGFTARQLLPEHQKQWLSWLAARGIDASAGSPDIHRAGRPHARQDHQRAARLFEGRDAGRLPRRRIHPLAVRAGARRAVVRACLLHLRRIRPSSCRNPTTRCTIRRTARLSGGRPRKAEARRSIPMSTTRSADQRVGDFVVGAKGKVARLSEAEFRQIRATLLRHDLGGRRPARTHLGRRQGHGAGTTRSSSSPPTMPR